MTTTTTTTTMRQQRRGIATYIGDITKLKSSSAYVEALLAWNSAEGFVPDIGSGGGWLYVDEELATLFEPSRYSGSSSPWADVRTAIEWFLVGLTDSRRVRTMLLECGRYNFMFLVTMADYFAAVDFLTEVEKELLLDAKMYFAYFSSAYAPAQSPVAT